MRTQSAIRPQAAFTLLELLTVLAIIGILAAIVAPNLHSFKPNVTAAATRQLLDDVARARQLAIANHTTVYMVFVPTNFWNDPAYNALTKTERDKATKLFDKQLTSYALVSTLSIGDQPGQPTPRYLSPWKTLPEGTYIPPQKFLDPSFGRTMDIYSNYVRLYTIPSFHSTRKVPFPSAQASPLPNGGGKLGPIYVALPYIAFDYMGRLSPELYDYEFIPLAKGSVFYHRDQTNGMGVASPAMPLEIPPGNVTNTYTLVRIDKLTGRPHAEHQEVQ